MTKEEVKEIIKHIFVWGFGAVIAIAGAITLILGCSKAVDLYYPQYMIIGSTLLSVGSAIYIIEYVLNWVSKVKYNKKTLDKAKTKC